MRFWSSKETVTCGGWRRWRRVDGVGGSHGGSVYAHRPWFIVGQPPRPAERSPPFSSLGQRARLSQREAYRFCAAPCIKFRTGFQPAARSRANAGRLSLRRAHKRSNKLHKPQRFLVCYRDASSGQKPHRQHRIAGLQGVRPPNDRVSAAALPPHRIAGLRFFIDPGPQQLCTACAQPQTR
jgi:hypothetical protein